MGMINGILPCGITYLALIYCFTLPAAIDGFYFMLLMGLGSLPAMIGALFFLNALKKLIPFAFPKFSTILLIAMGALLILRGFSPGYLLPIHTNTELVCNP
jgi:hypothetical protein